MKKIEYAKSPLIFTNGDFWHQWCCDCGLRHNFLFLIVRGIKPEDDVVQIYIERDDWATDADREIQRYKKKLKKVNIENAAIELGRRGGLKGGKARAKKLSAKRRSEIARNAANIRWKGKENGRKKKS